MSDFRARVVTNSDGDVRLHAFREPPGTGWLVLTITSKGAYLMLDERKPEHTFWTRQVKLQPRALREALLELESYAVGKP